MKSLLLFLVIVVVITPVASAENSDTLLLLMSNGQYSQAEVLSQELLSDDPDNLKILQILCDAHIAQNKFSQAQNTCLRILEISPGDHEVLLKIARLYSWTGDFAASVMFYDMAIDIAKNDIAPGIEKARVLGWSGKYAAAQRAYREVYRHFPEPWVHEEAAGKENLRKGRLKKAIGHFENALREKPENEEVLFDLAQIYSYGGGNPKADAYYAELLTYNPFHSAADQSRKKNHIDMTAVRLNGGMNMWSAESMERNTDVRVVSSHATASKRISNLTVSADMSREDFAFSKHAGLEQNSIGLSFDFRNPLRFGYGGGYAFRDIFTKDITRQSFYLYGWGKLFDRINLNATVAQNNMIHNHGSILSDLNERSAALNIEYPANDIFSAGGRYRAGYLSDDNSFMTGGLYSRYVIIKPPRNVYALLEIENSRYKSPSNNYFAPQNYSTFTTYIGFLHDIGRGGNYYGANRIYYDIKCRMTWDSEKKTALQPSLELSMDITRRMHLLIDCSKTESSYYDDFSLSTRLRYYYK